MPPPRMSTRWLRTYRAALEVPTEIGLSSAMLGRCLAVRQDGQSRKETAEHDDQDVEAARRSRRQKVTCKFLSANSSALKMFGATDEQEFLSRHPWEYSARRKPDG